MNQLALCWIRRDLRLHDHRALFEACLHFKKVIVIFIFDSVILTQLKTKNDSRVTFIYKSLEELDHNLKKNGSALLVSYGNPQVEIPKLAKTTGASAIFTNEDYEPNAKIRDLNIESKLKKNGVKFLKFKDQVIFNGNELKKKDNSPYQVFTPYKNAWLTKLNSHEMKSYNPNLKHLLPINLFPILPQFPSLKKIGFTKSELFIIPGEKSAQKYLDLFADKISDYAKTRNFPSIQGTSMLSVHLRFGTISIRECVRRCYKLSSPHLNVWLSEIIWRDFYQMILDQYPKVITHSFREKYNSMTWPGQHKHFKAWCTGMTGYPIIDAAMRQLNQTGWMHNRLRMIVACFLVKDLLIDWREGEKYFSEKLLDFDLAANNGGWQWCASTGCDAQPYFRIFNPIAQSKKFDPNGDFIRQYVPELQKFSNKDIHFPLDLKNSQMPNGFQLGLSYPKPIVDHSVQRIKALQLYKLI
jgi:deoxyribodipyrimidine photo-lyase